MARQKSLTVKQLVAEVPEEFLVDSQWLGARGFSRQLVHQYVQSGWLERVGHGLFRRPRSVAREGWTPDWLFPVLSAQWMGYRIHVGGPSALELHGHAHYLRLGGKTVRYLYSTSPPSWLKKLKLETELRFRKPSLFGDIKLGVTTLNSGAVEEGSPPGPWSFELVRSSSERAVLEALDELPSNEGFDDLDRVFESLTGLRPKLLTELLKDCRSVKVKRLFFVFADRHAHAWRKYLDVEEFDLGSGDREFIKGGRLHPGYRITVPPGFMPAGEVSSGT